MATFLTPKEVAERWGMSERHVERLCASGQLPAMKPGQKGWRIAVSTLEAHERARSNGAAPQLAPAAPVAEPIRPVFGVLEETGADLPLPERWWESQSTESAASSAAGRGRSTGKKKAGSAAN